VIVQASSNSLALAISVAEPPPVSRTYWSIAACCEKERPSGRRRIDPSLRDESHPALRSQLRNVKSTKEAKMLQNGRVATRIPAQDSAALGSSDRRGATLDEARLTAAGVALGPLLQCATGSSVT
jgi:hypothetical protein